MWNGIAGSGKVGRTWCEVWRENGVWVSGDGFLWDQFGKGSAEMGNYVTFICSATSTRIVTWSFHAVFCAKAGQET